MIVTSTKSIRIPKLNFGISAGEELELSQDLSPEEVERILQEPDIYVVTKGSKPTTPSHKTESDK